MFVIYFIIFLKKEFKTMKKIWNCIIGAIYGYTNNVEVIYNLMCNWIFSKNINIILKYILIIFVSICYMLYTIIPNTFLYVIKYGKNKKDGSHDHRFNTGDDRTPNQKRGDLARCNKV